MARIWMHSQNLTDTKRMGHYEGSIMRHGRAWLHFGRRVTIGWEWVFWVTRFGFSMDVNHHDHDLGFSFAIPGFQFYWHIEGVFPRKWKTHDLGRSTGLRIHSGALWLDIWTDNNGWSRDMPWYAKSKHFNPVDFLLGGTKHSERDIEVREAEIPMLERSYPVRVKIFESTWKRPRWPFARRLLRATVEPIEEGGIPVPGKGENSWDCGQDAIFASTFPCSQVNDAIAKFTASILETRHRYGGVGWKPEETKA